MADAESAHGDKFLKNLRPIPAKVIQLEAHVTGKEDLRRRGFNKLNVVVIETVFGADVQLGSGILCPHVKDWPEFGEEVDATPGGYEFQFILTAAHCVSQVFRGSTVKKPERMRVRIPKYAMWSSKLLKNFNPGPLEARTSERFMEISFMTKEEIDKYVHIYNCYEERGCNSLTGTDLALIKIPTYKCYLPMNTFQVWDKSVKPDGFSIVGFPADADKSYLPYFDRRNEFRDFAGSSSDPHHVQIFYKNSTSGGQSGGPVQFINLGENYRTVVGVHVTGNKGTDGEASGCMITEKVHEWIRERQDYLLKQDADTPAISKKVKATSPIEDNVGSMKQVEEEEVLAKKIEFDFEEIANRDAIQTLEGHAGTVSALCLDAEEKFLFSGSRDKKIIMWNMENYEKVKTFDGHTDFVYCVTVIHNGFLLSGGNDDVLKKWNIESGRCVGTMKTDGSCMSISMTSDERIAAIGNFSNKTLLTDIETMKVK